MNPVTLQILLAALQGLSPIVESTVAAIHPTDTAEQIKVNTGLQVASAALQVIQSIQLATAAPSVAVTPAVAPPTGFAAAAPSVAVTPAPPPVVDTSTTVRPAIFAAAAPSVAEIA